MWRHPSGTAETSTRTPHRRTPVPSVHRRTRARTTRTSPEAACDRAYRFSPPASMSRAGAGRLVIAPVAFHHAPLAVHVLRAHPVGETVVRSVLAPSLRRCIEISVNADELLAPAPIGRVGVEDLSSFVLEEDAVAGAVLQAGIHVFVVVEGTPCRDVLRRERDVKVVVEVGVVRRDPREAPPHSLTDRLDLLDRRARHGDIRHIMV